MTTVQDPTAPAAVAPTAHEVAERVFQAALGAFDTLTISSANGCSGTRRWPARARRPTRCGTW